MRWSLSFYVSLPLFLSLIYVYTYPFLYPVSTGIERNVYCSPDINTVYFCLIWVNSLLSDMFLCCFFKVYSRVILNIIIYFPIPEYLEGGINSLKVSGTFFFSIPGMTDSLQLLCISGYTLFSLMIQTADKKELDIELNFLLTDCQQISIGTAFPAFLLLALEANSFQKNTRI